MFNLRQAGENEAFRIQLNEAMADVFDQADFVFCSDQSGCRVPR